MITLVPIGGLCNKMRAIASAYALACKLQVQLKVIWINNADLGANFADLFKPSAYFKVLDLTPRSSLRGKLQMLFYLPPKCLLS
jgi:hypothetical protein